MKKLLLLLTCLAIPGIWWQAHAQLDPMYTNYMHNMQLVNPAYVGSRNALTAVGLYRLQWAGFFGKETPRTSTFSVNGPLLGENFGVGVAISKDAIAETKIWNTQLDFAYRLPLAKHLRLAMGLKGSIIRLDEELENVSRPIMDDPAFASNRYGRLLPNVGAGLYLHHDRYYVGVSVPQVLETKLVSGTVTGGLSTLRTRHYYGIAGAVFNLKNRLQLKPTILFKYAERSAMQVDLSACLIVQQRFSTGLMYRYGDALGLLLGFNCTEQLYIGYSYDWSFANRTPRYNGGSHEFVLRYDFLFRNSNGARSPRYF